jgi:hypothetical protein
MGLFFLIGGFPGTRSEKDYSRSSTLWSGGDGRHSCPNRHGWGGKSNPSRGIFYRWWSVFDGFLEYPELKVR